MSAAKRKTLRIAMAAWEIGRVSSGFGAKIGGLGTVMEELPEELVRAAKQRGIKLQIDLLSPCFAHYDREAIELIGAVPSALDGVEFEFHVYRRSISEGVTGIFFWDSWQLGWTTPNAVYPDDPFMATRLYAATAQAMAGFVSGGKYDALHIHDYHVGLIPFYLSAPLDDTLPMHFTIHNATHQGACPILEDPYGMLFDLNLDGYRLFHEYFDFFGHLNLLKAAVLKSHHSGGRVTTVSGDLSGSWGYAAELREDNDSLRARASHQKGGREVGEVFLPNRSLNVLEQIPVAGITNGLSETNWPRNLPQLKSTYLKQLAKRSGGLSLRNPLVSRSLLSKDHSFDAESLTKKAELKRLLCLEIFGSAIEGDPILLTVVGRLVAQKNLGLVAAVAERILDYDEGARFIILASAPDGTGRITEQEFLRLASWYPERFAFINDFNEVLGKLIQAGGDFMLIPSRFEPCGLVDYEASLLGNVVVGHRTGGLAKVSNCGYLYDWLDVSDYSGEANAFAAQIEWAIETYRREPDTHRARMLRGMALDASWSTSAGSYLDLYGYGLMILDWRKRLSGLAERFSEGLGEDLETLREFAEMEGPAFRNLQDLPLKHLLNSKPG